MSIVGQHRSALLIGGLVALSAIGAGTLRLVDGRSDAWVVLPLTVTWGLIAVLLGPKLGRPTVARVALAALLVRLPWVGTPPHLSDDLYRYLWEGAALAAGHDPFLEPPLSIGWLDDGLRALVNHPELTSVYPPLALGWFRLLAVGGTPAAAQAATALLDVALAALLVRASRRPTLAWVYALHPLPALESACGAHVDVAGVLLAALAVHAWGRGARAAAVWATVAGAATKVFPVMMLPTVLRGLPPGRAAVHLAASCGAVLCLGAAMVHVGPGLLSSASLYATTWEFVGFAHPWLAPLLGSWTRPALVAAGAAAVGLAVLRSREPLRVWAVAGGAFVLLSPTVHPWYVLWALVPGLLEGRLGWALAAVAAPNAYAVLATYDPTTGAWSEAPWLWWLVWGPALAGLAAGRWVQLRTDDQPTTVYPEANSNRNGSDAQ